MQLYVKLIILFIFVYALLLLNILQISDKNIIGKKMYLFVGLFTFEFIISGLAAFYNKTMIDAKKNIKNSLETALIGTLSYSIYLDTWDKQDKTIGAQQNILSSIFVTGGIATGYLIENMLK